MGAVMAQHVVAHELRDHEHPVGARQRVRVRQPQPQPLARGEVLREVAVLQVVQHHQAAAEPARHHRRQVVVREQRRLRVRGGIEAGALLGEEARAAAARLAQGEAARGRHLRHEARCQPRTLRAQHGGARALGVQAAQEVVEHVLRAADAAGAHEVRHHQQPGHRGRRNGQGGRCGQGMVHAREPAAVRRAAAGASGEARAGGRGAPE